MRSLFTLLMILPLGALAESARLPDDFLLIAHRGVTGEGRPENSLAALEETITRGYTHIEVDVWSTKDGEAVCLHDRRLTRTTGHKVNIDELTMAELRALAPVEIVPDFATFCARAAGRIGLMPDIKGYAQGMKEAFIAGLREPMEQHGLLDSALFIGRPDVGWAFEGTGARMAWRADLEATKKSTRLLENPGDTYFVFNHADDFDAAEVTGFQAMGFDVIVSINLFHYPEGDRLAQGLADCTRMIALGVDGLQLDSEFEPAVCGAFVE